MAADNRRVVVKVENGRPDLLTTPVRIALTTTLFEPYGPSHPYHPIVRSVRTFGQGDGRGELYIEWCPRFQLGFAIKQDRNLTYRQPSLGPIIPGEVATFTSSSSWATTAPKSNDQTPRPTSFLVSNQSGTSQDIVLGPRGKGWRVAYHPLESGRSITVPSDWRLQAYVVDDSIIQNDILQSEYIKYPVFPDPIPWDSLPTESTWILSQDSKGDIQINHPEFNPVRTVEKASTPVGRKDLLPEVLERLAMMEKFIGSMQQDVNAGQRTMQDIRKQLSALERTVSTNKDEGRTELYRNIAKVEAQTVTLAGSFDQSQHRLSAVHEVVTDTQGLLAGMKQSSNDQLQDLSRRLPLVESKAETAVSSAARSNIRLSALEETTGRTQDRVVTVENAVHQTQNQVSVVQQLIASNTQLAATRVNTGGVTPGPGKSPHEPPSDHDKRIPAIEVRVEKLERLTEERRKTSRAMSRQTQTELVAVQALVASLAKRVNAIEMKSEDEAEGEDPLSSASVEASPVMFPDHLADGPAAS